MHKFGLGADFVRLIMKCVTSVRFAVRMNGELLPFFTPSRGFRQGCPMSPYLFLLCAEGFTTLLNRYDGVYADKGIRVCTQSPWINQLLFADDSLTFKQAKLESAERLNNILRIYGECSGQCVNKEKSSIFFSPNTPHPVRVMLKCATGIAVEAFNERYLGLPTVIGRITSGTFDFIGERVRSKMNGRAGRLVSCAAREVLIKSKA